MTESQPDILDQFGYSPPMQEPVVQEAPPIQKDILDEMNISVPDVGQRNTDAINNVINLDSPKNDNEAQIAKDFDQNKDEILTVAKMYHTPEQIEWFKENPYTIYDTFDALKQSDITPGGSFYAGAEALNIKNIVEKKNRGEEISESETKQVDEYLKIYTEKALRGTTIGGGIAQTLAQMPAFAFEFVATGGAGKLAQTATIKAAEKVAVKSAIAGAVKTGAAKTAGVAANVATRTALTGMPFEGFGERRLNDFMTVTDKGELIFEQGKESPLKSALMAYGYSSIELGTEMAGAGLTKYLVSPAGTALKTPLVAAINSLPSSVRNNIYRAYKTIQPNASVSKVMTASGWNGMLEELGEERLAMVLNATLGYAGGDIKNFDDWLSALTPTKEQLLIETGAISIAGGIKKSADMTFNILKTKGVAPDVAKDMVNNMSANEQDQFVESNLVKPESGYQIVYHGTPREFTEFDASRIGSGEGAAAYGHGFYLTNNRKISEHYRTKLGNFVDENGALFDVENGLETTTAKSALAVGESLEDVISNLQNLIATGKFQESYSRDLEKIKKLKKTGTVYEVAIPGNDMLLDWNLPITEQSKPIKDALIKAGVDPTFASGAHLYRSLQQKLGSDKAASEYLNSIGISGHRYFADMQRGKRGEAGYNYVIYDPTIMKIAISSNEDLADGLPVTESPILEASAQQMQKAQEAEPPPIIDEESNFNQFYRLWVSELSPIQDLETMAREEGAEIKPGESPKLLSRMYASVITRVQSQLQVATDYINDLGQRIVTGKSLKSIMDDFDNMFIVTEPNRVAREEDFSAYLVATRYLEDLSKKEGVLVTEEQKAASIADLARLEQKYGENFEFFKTFAEEVYSFQRRILENLVRAKVMSQAQFDKIVKENPNYIPFQRVLEEETFGAITNSGLFTNANSRRIIKKIHGSEKEVKNIFESIIKNTARIMDYAERNKVAGSVAAMASYMPEYVQKTAPPVVKKGTAKIKVTFDRKLREKLQATISALGGKLERLKSIKVKGMRNVLGSYSPAEKAVRLKIGTTEGTMTHEVGHMIDFVFGLKEKLLNIPKVKKELQELAKQRLSANIELSKEGDDFRFKETVAEVGNQKYMDYILNDDEVIANFFDAYINSPKLAKEIAPTAFKAFEKLVKDTPEMAFIQDIKPSTERGEETIEQDVYGASPFTPPDTVIYFNEGKKEYYRVSRPIYEAMTQLSPTQLGFWEKLFMFPSSVLRLGATLTPEFMARSIVREGHTAMILSGVKFNPVQWVRGLFGVIGHVAGSRSDLYKEWQASGGKFNFYMELNDKGLEKAYNELLRPNGNFSAYLKNPFKVLVKLGVAVDEISRVGIYAAAKKQGYSDLEAAFISRDIYDYSRKGRYGKLVNRYVPFFNAGIQGADKFARAFQANPKAATFWAISTVTLPSMMLAGYYLYGADDDERKEYLEHPDYVRNLFWLYKRNGEWHKIPKPFTVGYLFGTIPEKLMIWMYEGDKPEGKALWQQLLIGTTGAVSPVYDPTSLIPTVVKPWIEGMTNYNFFLGRNIYPTWMDRLPPEERSNKFTSETAQVIGQKIGVSPALIDNAIRGQLGGSGKYATDAGDFILNTIKKANGEAVPEKPKSDTDTVLFRAFAQRRPAGYRSNSAGNFFDKWNELQKIHANYGRKEGKEKGEYFKENSKEISLYKPMKGYYDQMHGLQKEVDAIYDHKTMTAELKVERINALEDKITYTARKANKYFKKAMDGSND